MLLASVISAHRPRWIDSTHEITHIMDGAIIEICPPRVKNKLKTWESHPNHRHPLPPSAMGGGPCYLPHALRRRSNARALKARRLMVAGSGTSSILKILTVADALVVLSPKDMEFGISYGSDGPLRYSE